MAGFSETRLVTCAAFACLVTALLWVPWYQKGLSSQLLIYVQNMKENRKLVLS